MEDKLNPVVYRKHPNDVECIYVAEAFGFNLGSVIKSLWKAQFGDPSERVRHLKSAEFYLRRELERSTQPG